VHTATIATKRQPTWSCLTSRRGNPPGIAGLTGGELGPTLDFARRLAARSTPVWVRYVLAPGLTDDLAEVDAVARSAAGLGNVERIDIVPFHRRIDIVPFHRPGAAKYDRLGIPVRLRDTAPPGRDLVERVRGRFVAAGLTSY
jgi:pyruvate formate lyase activating enzyme